MPYFKTPAGYNVPILPRDPNAEYTDFILEERLDADVVIIKHHKGRKK